MTRARRRPRYDSKDAIALAFIAALQRLPPQERAVLLLRDVAGFPDAEVAEMLQMTTTSVGGALERARTTIDARIPTDRERPPLPHSARERKLLARFAEAFEAGDATALGELLTDNAVLAMPPQPVEHVGRDAISDFFANHFAVYAGRRTYSIWTRANGQPAFAHYIESAGRPACRSFGIFVLTLEGDLIAQLTRFGDAAMLRPFGLPPTLSE